MSMGRTLERKAVKMPEATVNAAGMRIVKLLVGNPPRTVADLIKVTRVTRTAVTEQLNELLAGGFVVRTTERLSGRGRPRHLYAATDAALLLLFASNQRLVVPAMWQAIAQIGGDELTREVLRQVSMVLAKHYKKLITGKTPKERLLAMGQVLRNEGGLVDIAEDDGQLIMHKRSCPFISMFEESRAVCNMDEQMMKVVVGARVRRTAWRHDGAPCCVFELASSNGK